MSQFEYASIPPERKEVYLGLAGAAFNEVADAVELDAIGITAEQMAYVGQYLSSSTEYMLSQPPEEWELQAIERHANLGSATLPEYVLGLICAGEENGSISRPTDTHPQPDSWYGI